MKKLLLFLFLGSNVFGQIQFIEQKNGPKLSYSSSSGVNILQIDGYQFKDLNKNSQLDPYEDWRLSVSERAKDLASKMSAEQIAGLMLYSAHQSIPARPGGYFAGTYGGKPFDPATMENYLLTDQQKKFLSEDNLRHVLVTTVSSPTDAAIWSNNIQSFCESVGLGIPANNSSDPRHGTQARAEFNAAAGGLISMWPSSLGLAASFEPSLVKEFGNIAAKEYRALGITTALSPQIDIATEPRWNRFDGTFGENSTMAAKFARAYVDGFQGENWGLNSVNAMVKHWPGGGAGESGRDAHYGIGKFAVYPGNNFDEHMIPFLEGAFKLDGKTKMASAVMPYYTISLGQDKKYGENVGNGYSQYILTDLLRKKYGYNGVICTDWLVVAPHREIDNFINGKPWGIENLNLVELHLKALMAGVDQYGGNNDKTPVLAAFDLGAEKIGQEAMRKRIEESAVRLLTNIFQVGLFENPYLDIEKTKEIVGNPDFMQKGFEAQLKSILMLKNKNHLLPLKKSTKIYVPRRYVPASRHFLGFPIPESNEYPINIDLVSKYFTVVENPQEADIALVCIESPKSGIGYDKKDVENGGNGYFPLSLQYGKYTADKAREVSIGGGDPLEKTSNRSYKGKSITASNTHDLELVLSTKEKMGNKPVIVSVLTSNPFVVNEFESKVDAIFLNFAVQDQALLDVISGKFNPIAKLPMQMPASMDEVEMQLEDVPNDMKPHIDSEGNSYDYGFGLTY